MPNGTTNVTYPQSLQQILGQPSQPGVFGYGLSQSDIQRLQDAGITQAQLMGLGLTTQPQTTASAYQSGGQGGPTTSPSAGGIQQSNNAALLQAMLKLGGPQKQDQTPPPPGNYYGQAFPMYAVDAQGNPTGKPSYANPTDLMGLLGAAALQSPYVKNQPPSAALDPRSGVSKVGGPLISANVPMVPGQQATWTQLAQANALSPNDIAEFQKTGLAPADVGKKFGLNLTVPQPQAVLAGPWSTQPGTFVKAPTPTPTQAAPLIAAQPATATAVTQPTPFGVPPAAPGMPAPMQMPLPVLAAHTSGLADAGRALFAHFGGDPNSAGPADIANFHTQLTGAIGSLPARPLAAAPQPTAAKKMRSGGLVPGRGNQDTVPALLTPGEYVIPKDQVAQVFGGRTPVRMAGGGDVTDDDRNTPSEARRQTLSVPTPPSQPSQPPAAPGGGGGHSSLISGLTQAAHAYNGAFSGRGGIPAGSTAGAGAYGTVGSYMAGQGSAGAAGTLGQLPAGGQLQSALGGIGSGLTQAAQAIASSVGPWQVQQSAIPDPSQFQRPPQIQFQQPRIV